MRIDEVKKRMAKGVYITLSGTLLIWEGKTRAGPNGRIGLKSFLKTVEITQHI